MSSEKINTRTNILEAAWHLLEERRGHNVTMSDIAKKVGLSRQALYLHFNSRTKLIIATVQYVDQVKGLSERLEGFKSATNAVELLEICVDIWGNYIPEVYGIAKAMINTRETDEATAAAWKECMSGLREVCQMAIDELDNEGTLSSEWSCNEAIEMFWTLMSINNWEQLTIECGWTKDEYITKMKALLKSTFVAT